MKKAFRIIILLIGLVALVCVVPNSPISVLNKTVDASPAIIGYNSSPTDFAFSPGVKTGLPATRAYDNDNSTFASWAYTRTATYGGSDGYFELNVYGPKAGPPRGSTITQVDLKIRYRVTSQATIDATLELTYLVNPSGTETSVYGPIREPSSAQPIDRTFTNVAEPNDGSWSWEDITNLKFRLNRVDPDAYDSGGTMYIYEVWATVYYDLTQTVAIDPKAQSPIPTSVEINVTGVEELYGFEFKLTYNTSVLTATGITYEYLDSVAGGGGANTYEYTIALNDAAGLVWATQSMTGDRRGGNLPSGTWGRLAIIAFTVDGTGPTNLDFEVKLAGHNYVLKKTYPIEFTLIQPGHDVAVTSVTALPLSATRGDLVDINATVKNEGAYIETAFNVTAYAEGILIETKTVASLGLGATTVVSFSWNTRDFQPGNYTITAIVTLRNADAEPADNIGTGPDVEVDPLFGDIDGDGWVDENDLSLLVNSYGSQPGDLNWNGDADLNNNNIVEAHDLYLLGIAWEPTP